MINLANFKRLKFPNDTKVKAEVGDAVTWLTLSDNEIGIVTEVSARSCIVEFENGQYRLSRTWSSFGQVKGFNHWHLYKATV